MAMAAHAKNTLIRRSGSSPAQWVHGRQPKLPASLLSDGGSIETCSLTSDSERLQQIEAVRVEAMCNHHRWEANQSLRAALLRKGRPYRGTFQPGQKVAYFRARTATGDGEGGYRQGIVLASDRNPSSNVALNIWIQTGPPHLRRAGMVESRRGRFGGLEKFGPGLAAAPPCVQTLRSSSSCI